MKSPTFIACGMYAFDPGLQQTWTRLFNHFFDVLDFSEPRPELVFETDENLLRNDTMLLGHTCGYPLMTRLQDRLVPFAVPVFDVPGCDGTLYSSRFIVAADAATDNLFECAGKRVAVNGLDSNSGMNVLRYALAELGARGEFFGEVLLTGGHRQSMLAVAENRADLAAIDCVSYQLNIDQTPALAGAVRGIGFSVKTCGLPLVVPLAQYSAVRVGEYLEALKEATRRLTPEHRAVLHLQDFAGVGLDDYQSIVELQKQAASGGYAELK